MTSVREMRAQTVAQPGKRSSVIGTLAVGVVAFMLGVGTIFVWKQFVRTSPPPIVGGSSPATASAPAPKFAGNRVGRAATAPLLRTCVQGDAFEPYDGNPQALYTVLTTAGTMSRIGSLIGAETGSGEQLTEYWREIAECVYRQNSWHICDADNRALAIESASGFIRTAARIAASSENTQARQRILDALRTRLRNGQIIADDFGPLPPQEIKALLASTATVSNGCVK